MLIKISKLKAEIRKSMLITDDEKAYNLLDNFLNSISDFTPGDDIELCEALAVLAEDAVTK